MARLRIPGRQQGFSLIELMVGVAVALIAVVVIMQIFQVFEGQRRTTTGGDDAGTTGAITMSLLQRDLRQAGQGLSHANLLGCTLTLPNGRTVTNLSGVFINDPTVPNGDANTDTVRVIYGGGAGSPEGTRIQAQPSAAAYLVAAPQAFVDNDFVVATPQNRAAACNVTLTQVNGAPAGSTVSVDVGTAGVANGALHNWGRAPVIQVYRVSGGRMMVCDFLTQDCTSAAAGNWTELAEGVVSMRAQYGVDTSGIMDSVVDAFDQTNNNTACSWYRRPVMRMALVLRNGQLEKENVTAAAPAWAGASGVAINLSGNPNWQRYRYKNFESTVALRNITWQGVIVGC